MKRMIAVSVCLASMVLLPCSAASADDGGITVDINVVGDSPTVNVDADGNNPSVYINGQDIQKPTAYYYAYENNYDDRAIVEGLQTLKVMLESTEMNLITTSEGLVAVIQVLDEHTSNLRDILDYSKELESKSVSRDNELADMGREQDARTTTLAGTLDVALRDITDNSIRIANLETRIADQENKLAELYSNLQRTYMFLGAGVLIILALSILGLFRRRSRRLKRD